MIHDTSGGGQDKVTELTGRQQVGSPLFEFGKLDVETGRDNTTLVKTTIELDDDLAGTVVIDLLEFANVTYSIPEIIKYANSNSGSNSFFSTRRKKSRIVRYVSPIAAGSSHSIACYPKRGQTTLISRCIKIQKLWGFQLEDSYVNGCVNSVSSSSCPETSFEIH